MKYVTRHYVALSTGEFALIGSQTLMDVMNGRKACPHDVGTEMHVIDVLCAKEGRKLTTALRTSFHKYKLLPSGFTDQEDFLRQLRHLNEIAQRVVQPRMCATSEDDAASPATDEANLAKWTWTPTAAQLEACSRKLGLPL